MEFKAREGLSPVDPVPTTAPSTDHFDNDRVNRRIVIKPHCTGLLLGWVVERDDLARAPRATHHDTWTSVGEEISKKVQ